MTGPADDNPLLSVVGPGRIVSGKYRIGNMLGSGSSSIVVEAHHIQNGQRYALKLLDADRVQRLGGPDVLLKAARAIAELKSEHTIRLLAVGALDNGAPYLLMEFLDGADFGRVLTERGPLRVSEAADAMMQACDSLAEAHGRGLVHGALKPQNLFVAKETDGRRILKVGDFGGFGALDPAHSGERHAHSFEYAAPEQLLGQKADARTDVWALGVILFELVSGARPFDAKHLDELVATRSTAPPPQLTSRYGPVPDAFEAAIRRCLAFDPGFRFQGAADVARAIAQFASGDLQDLVPRIERASDRPTRSGSTDAGLREDAPTQAAGQAGHLSANQVPNRSSYTSISAAPAAHQHFSAAMETETATTPLGRSGENRAPTPPPPPPMAARTDRISWSEVPTMERSNDETRLQPAMPRPSQASQPLRMPPRASQPPMQSATHLPAMQHIDRATPVAPLASAAAQQPQQLIAVVQSSSRATNILLAFIALALLLALPLLYLHSLAKKTEFAAPSSTVPNVEPTYTIEGPSAMPAPQLPPSALRPHRPPTAPPIRR